MKKFAIIFLWIFGIVTISFTGGYFVLAQTAGGTKEDIQVLNQEIAARKDKIQQLEKTIENYKKIIAEKETEAQSLRNQLSIIGNRIAQLEADIELTQEKIKETQLEIDALNISIGEKQKIITKQKKIIAKLVQSINNSDQKNYFEIMLTYKDFSEFYNEMKSTENVYVDLGRSVKTLRIATEELEAKKKQVEAKKKKYVELNLELEGKKGGLRSQEVAKQDLLTQTRSSEAKYQTLLASLKKQYQVIENEQRTYERRLKERLEEENKLSQSDSVSWTWPVPSRVITATFHDPSYPFKKVFEHSGVDIRAGQGTPVKAAASGYVARARTCSTSSCYAYVLMVHTGNLSTVYGHLSRIVVENDQFVNKGDVIGYSGAAPGSIGAGPFTTGAHLHFEVRYNGIPTDPLNYVSP